MSSSGRKETYASNFVGAIAAALLKENLDTGSIINIGTDIKVSKMQHLPIASSSSIFEAARQITGIFPPDQSFAFSYFGPAVPSDEPREFHITINPQNGTWRQLRPNSYIAVGEEGSLSLAHDTDETIEVTNGELIVTQKEVESGDTVTQVLREDDSMKIPAHTFHTHRAVRGYAAYHTTQDVVQSSTLHPEEPAESIELFSGIPNPKRS